MATRKPYRKMEDGTVEEVKLPIDTIDGLPNELKKLETIPALTNIEIENLLKGSK